MPVPEGTKPFTVSTITQSVKARLEEFYPNIWVVGEVVDFKRAASGHYYFSLKDHSATLRCMMWRSIGVRLRFDPRDGMQVVVRGSLSVYQSRGDLQMSCEELRILGEGEAELALRELKERLRIKGYFAPERKRSLPRFPQVIALVTSPTGDAIRDMLELIAQRWPVTRVIVCPSRVEGDTAAAELTSRLRLLSQLHRSRAFKLDAIVMGRGGGSAESLWVFNDEALADAIYEAAVPVISAIGHETDVTIADFVADHRAETPSAAMMTLMPNQFDMMSELDTYRKRLRESLVARLKLARTRLDQLVQRAAFRKPLNRFHDLAQRLDETEQRLNRAVRLRLERAKEQLATQVEQLEALSPLAVLKRGYSLTQREDNSLLRSVQNTTPGDVIRTRLADGDVLSTVTAVRPV